MSLCICFIMLGDNQQKYYPLLLLLSIIIHSRKPGFFEQTWTAWGPPPPRQSRSNVSGFIRGCRRITAVAVSWRNEAALLSTTCEVKRTHWEIEEENIVNAPSLVKRVWQNYTTVILTSLFYVLCLCQIYFKVMLIECNVVLFFYIGTAHGKKTYC